MQTWPSGWFAYGYTMYGMIGVGKQCQGILLVGHGCYLLKCFTGDASVRADRRNAVYTVIKIQVPAHGNVALKPKVEKPCVQSDRSIQMRTPDTFRRLAWCIVNELAVESDVCHGFFVADARFELRKWFTDLLAQTRMILFDHVSKKRH